ncbi:MAG: hypothetical protein KC620_18875, partial [Myxococcales bacterium]|nr:hypothetical protein [Myxococcales bacterium]
LWHRLTIEGPAPTGLIARLAVAIAARAPAAPARLMVPVDVRNYRRGLRATGNLSYPLFLEVAAEQPWRDVQRTVLKGLKDKAPLHLDPAERIAPWLPLWFFAGFYRLWIATQQRRGRYPFTALLSQIALQTTAPLDAPGFATRALFVLPMQSDIFPLTLAVATVAGRVDVVLSAPEALVDRAGLARLADAARAQLVAESVAAA